MSRDELKEIIAAVVKKMEASSPAAACFFWDQPVITTFYGIGEEDPTTRYAINEEDVTTLYGIGEEG